MKTSFSILLKHISRAISLFFFAAFLFSSPLIGQEASNLSIQYTNYNTRHGLPNQLINCIFQDSKGFFWIATNYGFSRFDGKSFVNYSPDDLGVSFGTITNILEDENGNLCLSEMSHESSLLKKRILTFNPNTETIKLYQKSSSQTYYSIANTPEKNIVLGTEKGDLLVVNQEEQEVVYSLKDRKPIIQIVASSHHYWLNSDEKITLIKRNGEFVKEWSSSHKFNILGSKEDGVYVREIRSSSLNTLEDQILLFKEDSVVPEVALVDKLNKASEIDEEWKYFPKEEKFIVYKQTGGLCFLEETGDNAHLIDSLGGDGMSFNVEHVYFCSNGFLWVSSISGVYKVQITPSKFESFLHKEKTLNFSMRSIVATGDSLYCNSYSGNIIYDLRKKEIVKRFPGNDIGDGLSSIKASNSCIYLAGTGTALQQICEDTGQENYFYHSSTRETPRDYWAIMEDSKKKIWLGTNQGLSFLDTENEILKPFKDYNQFTKLKETLIFDIIETGTAYWIASQDGLFKMEGDKGITSWFHSGEPTPDSAYLPANVIFDIHEDKEGMLWLTTFGSGLIKFNPQDLSYKQITVKEGLAHNVTNDILEDDFDNLWISTNKGIVCLNRKTGELVNFDKSNGLHFDEFNKKSSTKLDDGRFVFGGLNGFVVFHPKDFLKEKKKEIQSNLRIIQVIIGDEVKKSIDTSQPIVLSETKVDITFDLHLLEFVDEEPASYEWKWKDRETEFKPLPSFQLHLSEVPYGKSIITFRAKSAKGIPAINELDLNFSVPPLFSLSQLLIGLSIILASYFLLFIKNKKKKVEIKQLVIRKGKTTVTEAVIISEEKTPEQEQPQSPEVKPLILSPTDKKWLDDFRNIVQQSANLRQFSVEDMAREANLSSRQLSRKIKKITGITPNQFLRDIKLEKAKTLLESGTISTVAEASFAVGFEKPDYFSRLFQEKYGKRPVTYFDKKKKE